MTLDEEHIPAYQDSEINLLSSGEITWVLTLKLVILFPREWLSFECVNSSRMAVPLSMDDISQFGDGSRELFIKSSCYSIITVTVTDCGPTISWVFSSEPRSISFSVVYQESGDIQVEQSKVILIFSQRHVVEFRIHSFNFTWNLRTSEPFWCWGEVFCNRQTLTWFLFAKAECNAFQLLPKWNVRTLPKLFSDPLDWNCVHLLPSMRAFCSVVQTWWTEENCCRLTVLQISHKKCQRL